MYKDLQEALEERLVVVADHALRDADPSAHLEKLKRASARLDALAAQLPRDADPRLRHFLERQSYLKARDWLAANA
ncbi:MAG: hypothetical protein BGO12_23820 [Verrucomicrobia bacterium 61-8]|nr:hypothetical protein [Verrucomicrobiota bacterium]OJV03003.1 MAG: hypothetical protein BGO12_23820 [Verrucomicrobia bacterium 61-8]